MKNSNLTEAEKEASSLKKTEEEDTNKDLYGNDAIRGNISLRIEYLMENPSEFNETVVQHNPTVISTTVKKEEESQKKKQ
jgi:hypothetical protein